MFAFTSLIFFLLVTLLANWLKYRWNNRRYFELGWKLPGHDGLSYIKSYNMLLEAKIDNYKVFKNIIKEGAPITKLFCFDYLIIITKDADIIHQVLNSPQTYDKPEFIYEAFFIKKGLIVLNGDEHKKHRKILNKAFVPKILERLPQIFDRASMKMISKLSDKVDCGEFDVLDYAGAYSLEAIGTSNFGYETEYFKTDFHEANERSPEIMIEALAYYFIGFSKTALKWTETGRKSEKYRIIYDKFFDDVVKNYRKTENPEKNTIIDLLLDPANGFDDDEILEEYKTFFFAAFDTTSKTIATILMMLGIHKEAQQKLVDEIDTIYSECNNNVDFDLDFLQKFKYLEAVINESMRLYSVAPYSAREFTEETDLNGYLIPKGACIILSNDGMHKDEKYWGSDAHVFRPERFLEELKYPKAFKPFSGGRRICIGYRYAMISMKVFLINFLRAYKIDSSTMKHEDIKIKVTMTLCFVDGNKISIQKRKESKNP